MLKRLILLLGAGVPLLAVGLFGGFERTLGRGRRSAATAAFHDLGAAQAAGYAIHVQD